MSFLSPIQSIAFTMIAGSALVVVAAWRQRPRVRQAAAGGVPASVSTGIRIDAGTLDVAAEVWKALAEVLFEARRRRVAVEMAVQPDLMVRADRQRFAEVLTLLVRRALAHAGCGRVLVGAIRRGGRVRITVTDDGTQRTPAERSDLLQELGAILTPLGGTMYVDVRPGQGRTVAVHLPAAAGARDDHWGVPAHTSAALGPGRP